MVGTIGLVGGLASLGGGLAGMFGGGSSQPQMPQQVSGAEVVADQPALSGLLGGPTTGSPFGGAGPQTIGSLAQYNLGGQYMPAYQSALSTFLANPYGPGAQGAANQFGGLAMNTANQGFQNAGMVGGTVGPILQQAFDPQRALFQRTAGQVSDAELAALTNMGLGTTPVGAGAYGQTMSDFNLNWQNQQLQRMLAGVQGAGGAASSALGLGGGGLQLGMTGGVAPWQTYTNLQQLPLSAYGGASQYGQQAAAVPQTGIGDWLSYLSQSIGAQGQGTQAYAQQLAAQNQQFKQNQAFGTGIGAGLGGLGAWYGSPGGSALQGTFGPGGMFGSGTQFMGGGNWLMP